MNGAPKFGKPSRAATVGVFLWLLLGLSAAVGQELPVQSAPSYHRVSGVAPQDVLNIRSAPSADAPIIGALAPFAAPVEVVVSHAGWGRVTQGEQGGWVSMRYLAPIEMPEFGASGLPQGLVCAGTEPFWSLELGANGARMSELGGTTGVFQILDAEQAEGRPDPAALWLGGPAGPALAQLTRRYCTDTMTDRIYAYTAALALETAAGRRLLAGCCRVPLASQSGSKD
ncbi:MAG: SH3 domain-containing protein [Pikeienuella sp.]